MAKAYTKAVSVDAHKKFTDFREAMSGSLIEREEEVDVVLTALLCREHPLFVGPPGTAKSLMLDSVMEWLSTDLEGSAKFQILVSKFTVPEEVFGPISIKKLKEDKFERITKGMLPDVRFAFIDEIFKANSAILNTMLRILNERLYAFEPGIFSDVPLELCVAASNEWPNSEEGGKELGALFDRFLFRKTVKPISTEVGRRQLLWGVTTPNIASTLSSNELQTARVQSKNMEFSVDAKEALLDMISTLASEGIMPGDRRQKKSVMAARAYAWLQGGEQVEKEHLEILSHVLWDDPTEQPEKCAKIVMKIANPTGAIITEKLMQAVDIVNKNTPTEAVAKLQEVQRQLKEQPAHPKKDGAIRHIGQMIKQKLNAAIGYKEQDSE